MKILSNSLMSQKNAVIKNWRHLKNIYDLVDNPVSLNFSQGVCWFAVILDFKPDLIIELGRGYGNSSCMINEAAQLLPNTRIVSLCRSTGWEDRTLPELEKAVSPDWFKTLEVLTMNIEDFDIDRYVKEPNRIMVIWDAHGTGVADWMLSCLMPKIADKEHLIIMHDISDRRYAARDASYQGLGFWRGQDMAFSGKTDQLYLGWVITKVGQALPVVEFTSRNKTELYSADHDFRQNISPYPDLLEEIKSSYPKDFLDNLFHWAYFTLNDAPGPYHFPTYIDSS